MTNREAIERIKDHMHVHKIGKYKFMKFAEALNMSIAALKEQDKLKQMPRNRDIPMKATRELARERIREVNGGVFGKGTTIWFCPACGMFNTPTHKFCWECGQALIYDSSPDPGEPD